MIQCIYFNILIICLVSKSHFIEAIFYSGSQGQFIEENSLTVQ